MLVIFYLLPFLVSAHLASASGNNNSLTSHYDFIFGFSTGHVGTTTLSERRYFGMPEHVVFLHELHYGEFRIDTENIMNTRKWLLLNENAEYEYVRDIYVPFLLQSRKDRPTLLDLGHNNLYYVNALVKYLIEKDYKFIFVRIRRNRIEAAISLSYRTPTNLYHNLCDLDAGLQTRFCPYDREEGVILHPPSREIWDSFSVFQQALWITDETEARWQSLRRIFPSMEHIEVNWGKQWIGSIDAAALKIASLFGVDSIVPWDITWDHMHDHQHAGNHTAELTSDASEVSTQDYAYREAMKYTYLPG